MPLLSSTYRRTRLRKVGSIAHIIGNASRMYHESSFWYQPENIDDYQYPDGHQACNKTYRGVLQIKKTADKGLGLFADRDFAIGDLVMKSKPVATSNKRYSHSIQIDWNRHITMDLPAILINHSCEANVGIRNNSTNDAYNFYAISPITKGKELTWDYEASEWELSTPFDCGCGSSICRGRLKGFKSSGVIIRKRYGDYYADYLKSDQEQTAIKSDQNGGSSR